MAMNNSLAEVHPELVSEWSEKILTLTPDDITFGSNKKVWWRGACGHEWQTSVKARSNGEKCPICSGARVIAGINDLATLEPLLAKQWSKKNKIKPTEVSIGSHKKVIWRCEKGHEWETAVKSRTINKTDCPYCSGYAQRGIGGQNRPKIGKVYKKIRLFSKEPSKAGQKCGNICAFPPKQPRQGDARPRWPLTSGPVFSLYFSYPSTFTRIWSPAIILSYHLSCHRRTCRD